MVGSGRVSPGVVPSASSSPVDSLSLRPSKTKAPVARTREKTLSSFPVTMKFRLWRRMAGITAVFLLPAPQTRGRRLLSHARGSTGRNMMKLEPELFARLPRARALPNTGGTKEALRRSYYFSSFIVLHPTTTASPRLTLPRSTSWKSTHERGSPAMADKNLPR